MNKIKSILASIKALYGPTKIYIAKTYRLIIQLIKLARTEFAKLEKKYQRIVYVFFALILLNFGFRGYHFLSAKFSAEDSAIRVVSVVNPVVGGDANALSFPGRLEAFLNAPIYSRVNGYMKSWSKDIGSPVKKGELLGSIDAPEVDQQLHQAKADLESAKSNEALAKVTLQRWKSLLQVEAVSKQEYDQKVADYESKKSLLIIAQANLEKAKSFAEYKNIPAPFDGIITERNVDIGSLVSASGGKLLFNVSNIEKLRLFLNIPQIFRNDITEGMVAKIQAPEFPGKEFEAKVVRSSGAINENSGTTLVEIEIDNADHQLTAGAYVRVNLELPSDKNIPRLPTSALVTRKDGNFLFIVDAAGKAKLLKVELGRDFGQEVEVIGNVDEKSVVINSPSDNLLEGETVRIAGKTK